MIVEIVIVLLSQQGGWYQYCYLFVVFYGEEGGVYGYFGFVEVYIVVYQVVYGQWLVYIVEDGVDCLCLIWCGFKWEVVVEQLILFVVVFKGKICFCCVLGIDIQQFGCYVVYFFSCFLLCLGSGIVVQFVQGGVFFCFVGVVVDKMQG